MRMSQKNHSLWIAIFAIVFSAVTFAVPEKAKAHDSGLKGLYFKIETRGNIASGDDTPYAFDETDRQLREVDLDASGSFRTGAGIRIGKGWDFGILYSGLNSDGRDSHSTFTNVNLNNLSDNFQPPGTVAFGYNSADSINKFQYDVVDFEGAYSMDLGIVSLRLLGGVRWIDADHNTRTTFWQGPTMNVFERQVEQWGIGPRLGIESSLPLGSGGLSLSVAGSGSWLFGERERIDSHQGVANPNGSGDPYVTSVEEDNSVLNADAEIGIGYGLELGEGRSMLITLGYRGEAWWDVTDTSHEGLVSSTSATPLNVGDTEEEMFFHGPFLRGTLNF